MGQKQNESLQPFLDSADGNSLKVSLQYSCLPASKLFTFNISFPSLFSSRTENPNNPKELVTINPVMKVHLFSFLILMVITWGYSKSDIHVGYRVTLAVPIEYDMGFSGRAFLMDANHRQPNFRVALSVEPVKGRYSCSLQVFLGDVMVWNSGHYSQYYATDKCVLELTKDGDLQLKGNKEQVGWRTGTSGQGVERLQILLTGNLVLLDALNLIKWQSFNFPTDVMLWGQRLNVATRLTSFPANSSFFYSLEIQHKRVSLYLCSGKWNYSYWEFKPPKDENITFLEVGSKGLEFFNDKYQRFVQIPSERIQLQPFRFLALGNKTGNLGLYFYSPDEGKFEAAFQAVNSTCDLPLACRPYGICTFSNACSCIRLLTNETGRLSSGNCDEGFPGDFCESGQEVEMLELNGVTSVLRGAIERANITKEECASFCLDDCKCMAALYKYSLYGDHKDRDLGECFFYGMVVGVKQVERGEGLTYMVKVPKGTRIGGPGKSGIKRWVLVLVGVVDGFVILLVFGGLGYYLIRKRKNLQPATDNRTQR